MLWRQISFQITEEAQRERIGTWGNFQSDGNEKKTSAALTIKGIKYHQEKRTIMINMIVHKGSPSAVPRVIALAKTLTIPMLHFSEHSCSFPAYAP
jgi:hypothetical protein